jgi:predicted RNA-binding protein with PIN domain
MPYMIDGHNLIPKIPGLSLGMADDEMRLVQLLQEFCRRQRKQVEVYFDNAPPGLPRARLYGMVQAYFARAGQAADSLIAARLQRLGREARNWIVVSSDHYVQDRARAAKAQVLTAEAFAGLLRQSLQTSPPTAEKESDPSLSPQEVEEWLKMFGGEREADD